MTKGSYRFKMLLVLVVTGILLASQTALACTSIPVTPGASVDGSSMTTHNDDSTTDHTHIKIVREKDWPAGSMRPVLRNTDKEEYYQLRAPINKPGEIAQVLHTFSYVDSTYSFMNEKQVGMGETTIGQRGELNNNKGWFDHVELMRLALERASTAREAVTIMGTMAEKYGYCVSGELLSVIDPNEAWFFEIFGPGALWEPGSGEPGAVWVARRIPDGQVGVSANRSRIGAINVDDKENFMASPNIHSLAIQNGWWDPKSGKEFKVYEVYGGNKLSLGSRRREWRVLSLLAPSLNLDPWAEQYPFSIKPDKKVSVQDLMRISRDHYEGTEFDITKMFIAGPFGNPAPFTPAASANPKGSSGLERAISIQGCNYHTVVVARKWLPDWIGGMTWFGYASPNTTCYFPLYCGTKELPKSFNAGMRGGQYDFFSKESAWWAFNFVDNFVGMAYSYMINDVNEVKEKIEGEFFAMQHVIEKAATELYAKDPELARTFITNYTVAAANKVTDAWYDLASKLITRYNDGRIFGDYPVYKMDRVTVPDSWVKNTDFGQSTIPPAK